MCTSGLDCTDANERSLDRSDERCRLGPRHPSTGTWRIASHQLAGLPGQTLFARGAILSPSAADNNCAMEDERPQHVRRERRIGEDRILSLPNVVTSMRLILVPWFVFLLVQPHHEDWFGAAVLLAFLGSTDWVDGQLARRMDQVTTLGKILDPVADRVLLLTAAIGIVVMGAIPISIAAIALAREALVAIAAIALAMKGAKRIDVTRIGKAGAFGLMCAFPLFLAGHSTIGWHHGALVFAWIAAVIGLFFGWLSIIFYVPLARAALAEGRAASRSRAIMHRDDQAGP